MSSRSKRKRLSRGEIQKNARTGSGAPSWFKAGVESWAPEKKGKYEINVLPYEVTDKKHPDSGVEPGTIWYKRRMIVHRGIGPESQAYICPLSIGKPCPIHEDRIKLAKNKDTDEDVLRQLKGQGFTLMNIENPDDKDEVVVFTMSDGKFWSADAGLSKEIDEGDESNANFFDVKDGKTLVCRFSEESFQGSSFLRVNRIDFRDRKDMDEEEVLKKTHNLDEILNVLPYDKLKELYLQTNVEGGGASSSSSSSSSKSSESGSASSSSSSEEATKKEPSGASESGSGSSADSASSPASSSSGSSSASDSGSSPEK